MKCCVLVDAGAGLAYVSSKFISLKNGKPARTKIKTVQTLMSSSSKRIPNYSRQISDTKHQLNFEKELHKLEESVLVELPNSKYLELKNKYQDLKDLDINDNDPKTILPD